MKTKEQHRPQRSFEETEKEIAEFNREHQPLYDLIAGMKAQREAEHAAVLNLKNKNELSKSELMRVFREEKSEIKEALFAAQSALDECNDFFMQQTKPTKKRATPKTAKEADASTLST